MVDVVVALDLPFPVSIPLWSFRVVSCRMYEAETTKLKMKELNQDERVVA
jgi:hypothetical protein